jgi:hypothetical protein
MVASSRADGDAEFTRKMEFDNFVVPSCESCGTGVMKPTGKIFNFHLIYLY